MKPQKLILSAAISAGLAIAALSAQAADGDVPPDNPDLDVVVLDAGDPETPGDTPATPEGGESPEPVSADLPDVESVARDAEGTPYPEGGPAGLYNAIIDKQYKVGERVEIAEDGTTTVVTEGGTPGQLNALSRLRRNLERKLGNMGLDDPEAPEAPDDTPLAEETPTTETPEESVAEGEVVDPEIPAEPVPAEEPVVDPNTVAHDAEGNVYPAGGPSGLYNAILDKQNKVGETVETVETPDGSSTAVTAEGGTAGQQNALSRLRSNLERKLAKLGLLGDETGTPETPETPEGTDTTTPETDLGTAGLEVQRGGKPVKVTRIDKSSPAERPEKVTRVDKPGRPDKVERAEKPERPQKVERASRPERPEKPEKVSRAERPEKPQRPDKPQKPEKPDRPGKG